MMNASLVTILRGVGHRFTAAAGDVELLGRFAATRDESAFAALVQRHGPLVLGVCRRVLRDAHDAEDAFQVTFLVLARKAASLVCRTALASWLYGTAYRSALEIQRQAARRRRRESRVVPAQSGPAELDLRELQTVLDEEVRNLPEKYRAPFVLCCLDGRSKREAAADLGWKEGTVSGRLAQARHLLQQRLTRRGVTLMAALTAFALGPKASAQVPFLLLTTTSKLAVGGAASPIVAAAASQVLRSLLFTRAKLPFLLLAMGIIAIGAGGAGWASLFPGPDQEPPQGAAAHVERSQDALQLLTDAHGDPLPAGAVARLGTLRFRHGQPTYCVAFSPDGKLIASGSADHTVRIWDRATGKEVRRFTGHGNGVHFVTFTPDGRHVISASGGHAMKRSPDSTVRKWEVDTGKEVLLFPPNDWNREFSTLALSPDGKTLAACLSPKLYFYDVASGQVNQTYDTEGFVWKIRFSPDGRSLAMLAAGVGVSLIEVGTGKLLWRNQDQKGDAGRIELRQYGLAFAPDGKTLAARLDWQEPARVLDAATGRELRQLDKGRGPILFSPDSKRVILGGLDMNASAWDVEKGAKISTLDPSLADTHDLALTPDGSELVEAGGRALRFWDVATGRGMERPAAGQGHIMHISMAADGRHVTTASDYDVEASLRWWDLATGKQQSMLTGRLRMFAAFAPDGGSVATVEDQNRRLVVREPGSWKERSSTQLEPRNVQQLAFTADGKRLLGTGPESNAIRAWDPQTGLELASIGTLPGANARRLMPAPGGRYLAIGGRENVIRIWDIAAQKEVRQLIGQQGDVWAMAFSPDSKYLTAVTGSENSKNTVGFYSRGEDPCLRIWDIGTGQVVRTLIGPAGSWSVAWSPDGRTIASGGEDSNVRLWEVATGKERACLTGHQGPVTALAFTANGARLLSGSADTTVLVWDLAGLHRPLRPSASEDLPPLWEDLGSDDANLAFRAVQAMTSSPAPTLAMLRARLHAAVPVDPQRLAALLRDLDAASFAVREKASRDLEELGQPVRSALADFLQGNRSPEARRRAERLLETLQKEPPRAERRAIRSVEVLERIGTAEARKVLDVLGQGALEARLTLEARASLQRMR